MNERTTAFVIGFGLTIAAAVAWELALDYFDRARFAADVARDLEAIPVQEEAPE